MQILINLFIVALILAFAVAKLEIQIEGPDGWAKNLPTWKIKNKLTEFFFAEQPLTGYHVWLVIVLLIAFHAGFAIGYPWSFSLELKIIGCFLAAIVFEDFFWFVLNPSFGIKKFNRIGAYWHKSWVGVFPGFYIKYMTIAILLIVLSSIV
jgi:hypothetical protein